MNQFNPVEPLNLGSINPDYFPNTFSSPYWSSTTNAHGTDRAWYLSFNYGYDYQSMYKSDDYYVRAVRAGQAASLDRLIINGDGTVTDTTTGLMWQQATDGTMNWEGGIQHCEDLTLAGYDDWRLPNKRELGSIVDYSRYGPAIDTAVFPSTLSSDYWSSTTRAVYNPSAAWEVGFYYGSDDWRDKSSSFHVRAVRGGQARLLDHLVIWSAGQGSIWEIGNSMPITWYSQDISGEVEISVSRQGGKEGTFETIAAGTANDGEYHWTISGPASVNCMLKIEPLSDPGKGTVQGLFSIFD